MDIIDVILFVQSFIWASLLIKQPTQKSRYLGLAFLLISFIYALLYIRMVSEIHVPGFLIPVTAVAVALLLSFFQLKNSALSSSKMDYIAWGILVFLATLLCVLGIWLQSDGRSFWIYTILLAAITSLFDGYVYMKTLKKKILAGSFMEDPQSRLGFMILLDKILLIAMALLILLYPFNTVSYSPALRNSFHLLTAILVFVSGYLAVSASFIKEVAKRKIKKSNQENLEFIERLEQVMQEEKPYLDCELSLEKMAAMLGISEFELTRILNHEMNTSFYKLINDHRMETVLQKLKKPDNRKFTIMASAYESGFNSKSTFYRIFKEYTRMTPKKYLSKLK